MIVLLLTVHSLGLDVKRNEMNLFNVELQSVPHEERELNQEHVPSKVVEGV